MAKLSNEALEQQKIRHVDHSNFVLSRLYELVDSDTCDVVFCCSSAPSTYARSLTGETPERERERETPSSVADGSETWQERQQGAAARAAGAAPAGHGGTNSGAIREARTATAVDGGRDGQQAGDDPTADGRARSSGLPSPVDNEGGSSPRVASKEFRCHRLLFASSSEYFRALLYGGMSESETRRVELKDVTPECFETIMAYVYTGRVKLAAGKGERHYRFRSMKLQHAPLYPVRNHPAKVSECVIWSNVRGGPPLDDLL